MISKEQVADLRVGDVVEMTSDDWPAGSVVRGPLTASDWGDLGLYLLDGEIGVRNWQGGPYDPTGTLTVVSRAPRPLYVNHDRTKPVPGDVVRDADDEQGTTTWVKNSYGFSYEWLNNSVHVYVSREELPDRLRLLVDGETGRCVP